MIWTRETWLAESTLTAKRYKGIPVELELIMALRLTGPRFSRQQSQSAANCLCGILAASVCTPRESQNQERNTQNRSKQKPILLRIHFEKTRPQTNVYLSCAAGQHVTVKAETLNYPKKRSPEKTAKLHKVARNQKTWRKSFLTIIYLQISRIFRTCWVTHLKFIEWVEKIERTKRTKRTKLVPTILEQNWWKSCWNHSTETILNVQNPAWKSKEWPPSDHFLAILFEANVT